MVTYINNSLTQSKSLINNFCLCINNNDGTPRWIWPATNNKATFLEFYQATTWKQRLFALAVKLVFMVKLQRLVFKTVNYELCGKFVGEDWAIFMGTIGPNRKQIIIKNENVIMKVAKLQNAKNNLENEAEILRMIEPLNDSWTFKVPKLINYSYGSLEMEKLSNKGAMGNFSQVHTSALKDLRSYNQAQHTLSEWNRWSEIHQRLNELKNTNHPSIPDSVVQILYNWVVLEDMQVVTQFCLSHGDFTPWNCFKTHNNTLGIIDWELANRSMPIGYDFFHFYMQKGIMLERKNWKEIYSEMMKALTLSNKMQIFGSEDVNVDYYLRLYLIHHLSYYLSLYLNQSKWHQQIYWQIDVWADALIALDLNHDQRKTSIARIFDILGKYNYAVLKLGQNNPIDLDEYSDLDILIDRRDLNAMIERIKTLPCISSFRMVKKSFMTSIFIICTDGQTLSLDLIWKLKRKSIVLLSTEHLLKNAFINSYGVRVVSPEDDELYIKLFYGLNNSTIPGKYLINDSSFIVPQLKENGGVNRIINFISYCKDSIRNAFNNKGFTITFSGVDGAGKSTIISEIEKVIDKKLRKPVTVLRHRPSILPIISAYIYGKEKAEQLSIQRLPRMGDNSNYISSLLRFSYYYIDYLIGQWYVFFRYIIRGNIVVYDRYYYDFIQDPQRSNIKISRVIPRLGMLFIRVPKFNFFLYADPKVILSRKQELDHGTIQDLTIGYKSLFAEYADRYKKRTFSNIDNIDMQQTISEITNCLITKIYNS